MPLISDIQKSVGVSTLVAPGISLATDTYGAPEQVAAPTSAFIIDAGMERIGMPMRVEFGVSTPDGQVEWFVNGTSQAVLAPGADFMPAMEMGAQQQIVTAAFTIGGEAQSSVPLPVLHGAGMHSGEHNHTGEQDDLLALVRHRDATVVALADGDWSDPTIWSTGTVPGLHARILIPYGRTLRYDNAIPVRHDTLRVDGVLNFATDQSTQELVETFIVHPVGELTIGTGFGDRLPAQYSAKIQISNRAVSLDGSAPTYIDLARDPKLLGRGLIVMGRIVTFGHDRATHALTMPNAYPAIGDTSVFMAQEPRGWRVGDTIVVPGTMVDLDNNGVNRRYDEERVITAITDQGASGWQVSFVIPLAYDHNDHYAGVLSDNPQPYLDIINITKNIVLESEEAEGGDVQRRGHCMWAHDTADFDVWDMLSLRMGRTDKAINAGQISADGTGFEYFDQDVAYDGLQRDGDPLTEPLAANSNITGRYAFHGHMNGTDSTKTRLVRECLTVDNKGWGKVHHAGTVDWVNCAMYRVQGAGMVSETANEFGKWDNCVVAGLETTNGSYAYPKIAEDIGGGKRGNFARNGYGFFYRGRTMIITRCRAYGMTTGHVFYHRTYQNGFSDRIQPKRSDVDLNDLDVTSGSAPVDEISSVNYPIVHFKDCSSWGCRMGGIVIKENPRQFNAWNVQIADFTAIACGAVGFALDYIGSYLVRRIYATLSDFISQTSYGNGVSQVAVTMGNTGVIGFDEITAYGFDNGILFAKTTLATTAFDQDNPHYIVRRTSFTDVRIPLASIDKDLSFASVPYDDAQSSVPGEVKLLAEVDVTEGVPPAINLPFVLGFWNGSSSRGTFSGSRSDNAIISGPLPSILDDFGIINDANFASEVRRQELRDTYGTFSVVDPDDGQTKICILAPYYWGDAITAYATKTLHGYEYTGTNFNYLPGGSKHNGTLQRLDAAPDRADISVTVPRNTTVNFNAITEGAGTTAGTGAVLSLDIPWFHGNADVPLPTPPHLKPNYCKATVSANGGISLAGPEFLLPGNQPEEMWVFIYDGALDFKAVKITINVT